MKDELKRLLDEFEEATALDAHESHRSIEVMPDPRPSAAKARAGIEALFNKLLAKVSPTDDELDSLMEQIIEEVDHDSPLNTDDVHAIIRKWLSVT